MASAYLSALVNYWGRLSTNTVARLNKASTLIQQGNYEPKHLLSDVLGTWSDGVEGWWNSLLLSAGGPVPVFFQTLPAGQTSVTGDVTVEIPSNTQPQCTDLRATGSAAVISAQNDIGLTVTDGTTLKILVENIDPAARGLYQGLVYAQSRPLVHVIVLVP